jgi:HAE1 family hydrophobic/amphiphilic exporter-1
MWLTRRAIDRPLLTALLAIALVLLGLVGGASLPVDLNPKADLGTITVTCLYPGAAPDTVEATIATPLEECLKPVARLKHVYTISQDSFCYAFCDFEVGADLRQAQADCRDAIAANRLKFPAGMNDPSVAALDINAQPVLFLGLVGDRPPDELRRLATTLVEPRLRAVTGVTAVEVLGGQTREIAVDIDRAKLAASGLLLSRLGEILSAGGQNVPGGDLDDGPRRSPVRLIGRYRSLDDLRNLPLPPPDDPGKLVEQALRPQPPHPAQRALRLGDLGRVSLKAVDPEVRVRLGGRPAVGLIVTKRGDGNTIRIAREARAAANSAPLPPDVKVEVARDTARTVAEALTDVATSLVLAVLLCSLAMLLFLRNGRATLIVICTIPVCLLGALAPMHWGGHTLNQMTLLGLAISIGILVDDSIVCIEAITHRLQQGESAAEAAFNGRNDIALADTSTTLLDLAVYGPIAVMAGTVGQFFRDFGFVVAVSAGLSLLAAFTIVPALAAYFYRVSPPRAEDLAPNGLLAAIGTRYARLLAAALDHRWRTLALGWGGLLIAGVVAWRALGVDFIPAADLGTVVVNLELGAGASPAATEAAVIEAEQRLAAVPEIETLFDTLGRVEVGFGIVSRQGPQHAQLNLTLRDRRGMLDRLLLRGRQMRLRSDDAVADDIRARLRDVPGVTFEVIAVHGWGGAGAPVDFSLYGKDAERLAAAGAEILDGLKSIPGILSPDLAWRLAAPEVQVTIDRARAREAYVYPGPVARELRDAVAGTEAGSYPLGDEVLPIMLRLADTDRRVAADVARIPVGRGAGRALTIGDVATVTQAAGPTRIDRRDGLKDLNLKAYLAAGIDLGAAQAAIEQVVARVGVPAERRPLPAGARYPELQWGWRGDAATLDESTGDMIRTAVLGLLLAYLVMAVLFNSALHPLTILLSVPMAGTGALLLLALTGSTLSIVSGIGFILLIGIVVRNAILLIDYILQLRRAGVERREAVERSGARRLRPILMTTFTTTVGMLPVALKIGKGAEIRAPMAIAVIGGLLLSTLLTLVIVPVTYTLLDDWVEWRHRS